MNRERSPKTAVTIKDVAREAGVSFQTVSKVINGREKLVAPSTRSKVLSVIDQLGYQPNYVASTLRSGKRMSIGVICGAHFKDMQNFDLARYFAGIGERCEEAGYYVTFMPQCCQLGGESLNTRLRKAVNSRAVDGVIMLVFSHLRNHFHEETLPIFTQGNMPLVAMQLNADAYDCPSVGFDIEEAGFQSTLHLIKQGHEDIACCARDNPYGIEYFRGYCEAMKKNNLEIHPHKVVSDYNSVKGGVEFAMQEMEKPCLHRAYLICRDVVAFGFIEALRKKGINVPNDIAVMGCDNIIDETQYLSGVSTVDRKFEQHGYQAADLLFDILSKESDTEQRIIKPELIIRSSSIKKT